MKNLWIFLGVIASVILTGCGAPVSTGILDQDWCYLFDFTQNQQGFLISTGTMLPEGMASDGTGLLQTSYGYNRDVYPSIVQVRVFRPPGVEDEILTTAAGTVFGVSAYFTAPMPAELDSAELTFTPESGGGVEIIGDRNAINITIDATQPIGIESIYIGGMGASPFPYNLCAPDTPTPPVDINGTGTAIASTPSPSPTVTATGTPPTATDVPEAWICLFDFTVSDYGWSAMEEFVGPLSRDSSGWHSGWIGNLRGVALRYSQSLSITSITVDLTRTAGTQPATADTHAIYPGTGAAYWALNAVSAPPEPLTVTGSQFFDDVRIRIWSGQGFTDPGGEVDIRSIKLEGTGAPPIDCPELATPTPAPTSTVSTPTPAMTNTQEPLWSQCVDFTASNYGFTGVGADYEDERGFIQEDEDEWKIGRSGLDPSGKKKFKLEFGSGQTFDGQIRLTDNATHSTSWLTVAGNEVFVDFTAASWFPTSVFWAEFEGGFEGLILERICWMDPIPSTGTPIPVTGTRTPLPTMTGTIAPSRTPFYVPPPVIIITATNGVFITTTPLFGGTGMPAATGTPGPGTGTPGSGTPSGGSGGAGNAGDVGDMVGFGLQIGTGLFGTLSAYLGQANSIIQDLLSAFINATPQPIPGLPLCVTNPMAHDICAIYYILDWTIFAPATPGALIVPLLVIIFNIYIAIYFVRWVLRLIRRGEGVTDVE